MHRRAILVVKDSMRLLKKSCRIKTRRRSRYGKKNCGKDIKKFFYKKKEISKSSADYLHGFSLSFSLQKNINKILTKSIKYLSNPTAAHLETYFPNGQNESSLQKDRKVI